MTTSQPSTESREQGPLAWCRRSLFAPVDIASLVYFRIVFASILLWEYWRYFQYDRIERYWINTQFHFKYFGFGWIPEWSATGIYWHACLLVFFTICLGIGLWTRLSSIAVFFGFTYLFLFDQADYLNHFYLVCLMSFLMMFLPVGRAFSVDVAWRRVRPATTAPAWTLGLVLFQLGIVYFFGGVAKLNADWLHGEPLRHWLSDRTDFPVIGRFFREEWMVYTFCYSGLLLDLLIAPLLLWRRSRIFALCVGTAFHLTNARLFQIGIFPWFMIAANLMFLPPHWPRVVVRFVARTLRMSPPEQSAIPADSPSRFRQHTTMVLLSLYLVYQVAMPLRHWLYPGDVNWTEEGHLFSWRMKLRSKSGKVQFIVVNPANGSQRVADLGDYLVRRQISEMSSRPEMIQQFAQFLASEYRKQGGDRVEVHVDTWVGLNGRKKQRLIDLRVDLAAQPRSLAPAKWILRLNTPLPAPNSRGQKSVVKRGENDESLVR